MIEQDPAATAGAAVAVNAASVVSAAAIQVSGLIMVWSFQVRHRCAGAGARDVRLGRIL